MNTPLPAPRALAQHEREMLVGAYLDITSAQWKAWIETVGDDGIPDELHQHVSATILGLEGLQGVTYQEYLQAVCLLADSSLLWLVEQAGTSPFATGDTP